MADIRINALATTAASTASDDFVAVDGSANGTRKLNAYSPTFGGNLTVSGNAAIGTDVFKIDSTNTRILFGLAAALQGDTVEIAAKSNAGAISLFGRASNNQSVISFRQNGSTTQKAFVQGGDTGLELGSGSSIGLTINSSNNTSLAGNLTVSGTGTSSVAGTLNVSGGFILNRINAKGIYTGTSDNCGFTWTGTNGEFSTASGSLILKSAGTTALTLDSSQNATFAGKVTAGTWADVVSARLGVATSANSYTATIANNASSGGAYALRLHTTGTASSDYIVVGSSGASAGSIRFLADGAGNFVVNNAAIATTATDGFLYVATCAGTPTGTPTSYTGRAPIVVDTTNNKLYFYSSGAWRDAGP